MHDLTGIVDAKNSLLSVMMFTDSEAKDAKNLATSYEGEASINVLGSELSLNEFWYRTGVRMMFAHIEAIVFSMKQLAIKLQGHQAVYFNLGEVFHLYEYSYQMSEDGEVVEKTSGLKIRWKPNVRFALRALERTLKSSHSVDFNSEGWRNLVAASKIRDRLTHPRTQTDLGISMDEYNQVEAAYNWFKDQVNQLLSNADWTNVQSILDEFDTDS